MPETTPSSDSSTATQTQRWARYGTQVGILVIATVVIVVLANWIAFEQSRSGQWRRLDMTATRSYSLSPQTAAILGKLTQPLRITTLFTQSKVRDSIESDRLDLIRDLLREYRGHNRQIELEQIDPGSDPVAFDAFSLRLAQRFDGTIQNHRKQFELLRDLYKELEQFAQAQPQQLTDTLVELPATDAVTPLLIRQLNQFFTRKPEEYSQISSRIQTTLGDNLPNLLRARNESIAPLLELTQRVLKPAQREFEKVLERPEAEPATRNALLRLLALYQPVLEKSNATLDRLRELNSDAYDMVREKVLQTHAVMIERTQAGPDEPALLVLGFQEIFPLAPATKNGGRAAAEQGYRGEEAMTGAILQLTHRHNTHVVFANPTRVPVLFREITDRPLSWLAVANRLRAMNFKVSEWMPAGGIGPAGATISPQPMPQAAPGEKLVFVMLPSSTPQSNESINVAAPVAAGKIHAFVESGGSALFLIGPTSLRKFGEPDPITDPLRQRFGVDVDTSRWIYQEIADAQGKTQATASLLLNEWPPEHPIGRSLTGLAGYLHEGMAIKFTDNADPAIHRWPLVRTPATTWADTRTGDPSRIKPDADDPTGPLLSAIAAQDGDRRLVVIANPFWATDQITRYGPRNLTGQLQHSSFPANAELFVNSIYWLSGQEELIGPGAHSRDVRRIGEVSTLAMNIIASIVLIVLPIGSLAAGVAVWFLRRR